MEQYISKTGGALAGLFLLVAAYFIVTQGLFGESFIALILGLPWVLFLSYFEFFSPSSEIILGILLLLPIVINAALLYGAGVVFDWFMLQRQGNLSSGNA